MAIVLSLLTRNVLLSLGSAVFLGVLILDSFSLFTSFKDFFMLFVTLLSQAWIVKTLAFALLVGAIIELLERSGAIGEFVAYLVEKRSLVRSGRGALVLSYIIGVVIFVESSITSLVAGAVGRPLCERYGINHAKLAYVCDSTSAPVSSILLFNGWGALLLGLLMTQIESNHLEIEGVTLLMEAVFFNFYALSALVVTFLVVWFELYTKKMEASPLEVKKEHKGEHIQTQASLFAMLLPLLVLVLGVFVFLYITGGGDILKGSGSSAIFYTTLLTLAVMFVLYVPKGRLSVAEFAQGLWQGVQKLFPIALVLLFAFAIGKITTQLHTGEYLASFIDGGFDVVYLSAAVFVVSALISFSTGTSWGTFSIMIPIAFPLALSLDANLPLVVGAVISGGVFGDHCSPISDTTIISSLASECEVVEHVQTQLPYALVSGAVALVLFLVFSYL